jgi:N-acetylmuramoyl-L-alanine amidase
MAVIKKYFSLCILMTCVCGCATTRPVVTPPVVQEKAIALKSLCEQNGVEWKWDSLSQVVTLQGNHLQAKLLIGSDVVLLGQDRITMNEPVTMVKSAVMVPYEFKRLVMSRLIEEVVTPEEFDIKKIQTIVIDPGHGGKDPGAIGTRGTYEKDVVLSISQKLKSLLEARGFEVIMTRETDRFISLKKRTEIASRQRADLFISIHANASTTRRASGIEVFSLRDLSTYELNDYQRKRNQYLLFRNFLMEPDNHIKSILSDMLYDHKCHQDDLLAAYAVRRLSQYARARNRGYKKAGFFVLKNTLIPAILVEVGFISNPKEERLLNTPRYRHNIARSLAQIIVDYNRYSDETLCREMGYNASPNK